MEKICDKHHLLGDNEGVVRIPFMVKGRIIAPPAIDLEQIETAFDGVADDALYLKLPDAQLIREPVIDRRHMRYSGGFSYKVLPSICGSELIETDTNKLARGLYALSVGDILGNPGRTLDYRFSANFILRGAMMEKEWYNMPASGRAHDRT